jgi:23S rRNA (guanine745-N1)-methyltransferase
VCPVCGASFTLGGPVLRCATGHAFDVARQGYVNLMPGGARPGTADTTEMVADRAAFLGAGHYAPLAQALGDLTLADLSARAPADVDGPVVLDAGAGTGYYLAAVLDRLGPPAVGLAMDVSVPALRRAARAAWAAPGIARPAPGIARATPGIGAIGWDTWQPFPVRPGAVSLILNVFAPRNGPEFHRVLQPGGTLIVVTPAEGHLSELVGPAGLLTVDEHKDSRLAATLGPYFTVTTRRDLTVPLHLTSAEAATLVGMGPSAWHTDPAATRARLAPLPEPIAVTAAFTITLYHPR